jgi:hypothetical protein
VSGIARAARRDGGATLRPGCVLSDSTLVPSPSPATSSILTKHETPRTGAFGRVAPFRAAPTVIVTLSADGRRWLVNDDDDNVVASLIGLWGPWTAERSLPQMLASIADLAVRVITEADGAALTMLADGRAERVVIGTEMARTIEDLQLHLDEGPGISALRTRDVQLSGSLGGDPRWPRFGPRVGRMGVHSVLTLPLLLGVGSSSPPMLVGSMTLYAHAKNAFSADTLRAGNLFVRPAAVLMHNAQALCDAERLVEQLQEALTSRKLIDRAIGILMARTGDDPQHAFDRLRALSHAQHVKVVEVAGTLVDAAVRRARARRTADTTPVDGAVETYESTYGSRAEQ